MDHQIKESEMSQKKISAVIQARFASTRLRGKVLMPLPYSSDQAVLDQIVRRLSHSRFQPLIVLATSTNPADDILETWALRQNIHCLRGDERNVLSRFQEAGLRYQPDTIIRITADNPFIDPALMDEVVEKHLDSGHAYTYSSGLPVGMNIEVVETEALLQLRTLDLLPEEEEHVTLAIRKRPERFKVNTIHMDIPPGGELRLTVDNDLDYVLACCIYDELYPDDPLFGLDKIASLIARRPWIAMINAGSVQKTSGQTLEEELQAATRLLEQQELFKAAGVLRQHKP